MRQEDTISGRTRAAIEALAPASLAEIIQQEPGATAQLLYALTKAGHVIRTGTRGRYRYSPGRAPQPYGGTAAERRARNRERKDRANERARKKYAEARGGKVKPRFVPDPKRVAPRKPTARQREVIRPSVVALFAPPPPPKPRRMTSQEWEAQGGKVQRLPPGAVSKSLLRFHPAPEFPSTTD